MKVLNIVSSGYRATLEEQDDTIIWLTQVLKTAGAEVDVLLRGSAVNYVVEGQKVAPLQIGTRVQRHAPDVHGQVKELAARGVVIHVQAADLENRGLSGAPMLGGVRKVAADQLPELVSRYDQVWHW
jgi:sulfur relay (sulfurtransferase) DsrF/TusC family protein